MGFHFSLFIQSDSHIQRTGKSPPVQHFLGRQCLHQTFAFPWSPAAHRSDCMRNFIQNNILSVLFFRLITQRADRWG